jgi:hypothetical protein
MRRGSDECAGFAEPQGHPPCADPMISRFLSKLACCATSTSGVALGSAGVSPVRNEGGIDGSNDARVVQLVGQSAAASPRV